MSNPGVVVLDFLSESSCSVKMNEPAAKKIRIRTINVWLKKGVYLSQEEAIIAIGSAFKKQYTNETHNCTKVTYYCVLHGIECEVRKLLSYPKDSVEVIYFENF